MIPSKTDEDNLIIENFIKFMISDIESLDPDFLNFIDNNFWDLT